MYKSGIEMIYFASLYYYKTPIFRKSKEFCFDRFKSNTLMGEKS